MTTVDDETIFAPLPIDQPNTTIDPTNEDIWITPLMGPAHLFRVGQSEAVCGRPWIGQAWDGARKRPRLELCCFTCVEIAELSQESKA